GQDGEAGGPAFGRGDHVVRHGDGQGPGAGRGGGDNGLPHLRDAHGQDSFFSSAVTRFSRAASRSSVVGGFGAGGGGFGAGVVPRDQLAGWARRSATRRRMPRMDTPRGSTFPGCHSAWPMTEVSPFLPQPCARSTAADARTMASTCTSGHGSLPSPRFSHS